jgi:predicted RNA-binding protein YlxR (DUF448 family)
MMAKRRKHVPQRTCVACQTGRSKRELIRIVRTLEGMAVVDETGKASGRGAYICRQRSCWEAALSAQRLERALKVSLTEENRSQLRSFAEGLASEG